VTDRNRVASKPLTESELARLAVSSMPPDLARFYQSVLAASPERRREALRFLESRPLQRGASAQHRS
jgi:hypothetical protein